MAIKQTVSDRSGAPAWYRPLHDELQGLPLEHRNLSTRFTRKLKPFGQLGGWIAVNLLILFIINLLLSL